MKSFFIRIKYRLFIYIVLVNGIYACAPNLEAPVKSTGTADVSKFIAIGDSYLSGYQDNGWYRSGQEESVPALMARQFGVPFKQPLVPEGNGLGVSPPLTLGGYYTLQKIIDCKGVETLQPREIGPYDTRILSEKSPDVGARFQNFSVPLTKSHELVSPNLQILNFFYRWFAPDAQTAVWNLVDDSRASFFTIWVGAGDYLLYAVSGGGGNASGTGLYDVTPVATFSASLDSLIRGARKYGGRGLIATLPSMSSLPVFNTLPFDTLILNANEAQNLTTLYNSGALVFKAGRNPLVVKDKSGAVRFIKSTEKILLTANDHIFCDSSGSYQPLEPQYFLEESEILIIETAEKTYNQLIRQTADAYDLGLVDMNVFFKKLEKTTYFEGVPLSNQFILGGFYSLDGIHPAPRGQALIANEFIKVFNLKFKAAVPPLDITRFPGPKFP